MRENPIIKQVLNHEVLVTGEGNTKGGWFTCKNEDDNKTLGHPVIFNIRIESDGASYLLLSESLCGEFYSDTWHETLEDAERVAMAEYGIRSWNT